MPVIPRDRPLHRATVGNHPPSFIRGHFQAVALCENSSALAINVFLAIVDSDGAQTENWYAIVLPSHGTANANFFTTSNGAVITPTGLSYTPDSGYSGPDTLVVSVTDGIASDTTAIYFTIHPAPFAGVITGPRSICLGTTATLADTTSGGRWTSTNSNATVFGGVVTSVTPGLDTIRYSVPGAFCTAVATHIVSIDTFPSGGAITGSSSVCVGTTVFLTDSIPGGIWSAGNSRVTDSGGIVRGLRVGLDTLTYTVTNACGTAFTTTTINVITVVSPGSISGPGALCVGDSILLADPVVGGIWSRSNTNVYLSNGEVVGLSAGTTTISYSMSNACGTTYAVYTVTINPLPAPGVIYGPAAVCVGDSITLTDNTAGGLWYIDTSADATLISIINGAVITGLKAGSAMVTYQATNNCGVRAATQALTVNPLPTIPVVTHGNSFLSIPAGYTSYQWLRNGQVIPGAISDSLYITVSGAYSVKVTNIQGCAVVTPPQDQISCDPNNLTIYPNPVQSSLNIRWCKNVSVTISCIDGRLVLTGKNVNAVDVSNLQEGLYVLSVYDENGMRIKTLRFVKKYGR